MINLIGSLVFGVGQLVVGAFLLVHGIQAERWRRLGTFITMLVGAWFITSGSAELLVSGMEAGAASRARPQRARLRVMARAS